jgi:homoserine kinase
MALPHRSVTVRVPATSANMGPGFDCVGMALNLWNDATVTVDDAPHPGAGGVGGAGSAGFARMAITVEGEGADVLPRDDTNLVVAGLKLAFQRSRLPQPWAPLRIHLVNRVPIGAGLGSSSAAIVSGLLAGLALTGTTLPVSAEETALQLAALVEGHVDNLAPCIYGGACVSRGGRGLCHAPRHAACSSRSRR